MKLYLEDIKIANERIVKYTKNINFSGFCGNYMVIDAVIRNLSIIGEAIKNISNELKKKYPEIPWAEIIGMRNKTIHEYFGVDENILWKTIRQDIPKLQKQILGIIKEEKR